MLLKSGAVLVLMGFAFVSSSFGATSGTITLQGAVANSVSIQVNGMANYNSLDLSATVTDLSVANVIERSNVATGYKVTLASSNSGALKNGTAGSLAYTAKYNGSSVILSSTPQTVTNVTSQSSIANVTKQLAISYTGAAAETMVAGTYSDTLTFTIAAN